MQKITSVLSFKLLDIYFQTVAFTGAVFIYIQEITLRDFMLSREWEISDYAVYCLQFRIFPFRNWVT